MYLKIILLMLMSSFTNCSTTNTSEISKTNNAIIEADKLTNDGLYREAIVKYFRSIKTFPQDIRAYRTLGILLVKTGQYKRSLRFLKKAVTSYPADFETNYYLAEALRTLSRYDDAIYRYKTALNSKPNNINALKALSWTYYKIGYYTATLKVARVLRSIQPKDFQHSVIAARAQIKMGRNKVALRIIEKAKSIITKSQLPFILSVEADAYLAMGDLEKAESTYRIVLKDQPLLASSLLGLGKTLLYMGKNKERAIEYIERSYRLRPQMIESKYILSKVLESVDKKKARYFRKAYFKQYRKDPLLAKRAVKGLKLLVRSKVSKSSIK